MVTTPSYPEAFVLPQYISLHLLLLIYCQILKKTQTQQKDNILSLRVQTSPWMGLHILKGMGSHPKRQKVLESGVHKGKHWQKEGGTSFALCIGQTSWLQFFMQNPCCRNTLPLLVWYSSQEKTAPLTETCISHCLLPHSALKSIKTAPDWFFFSCSAHEVSLRLTCRMV